MCHLICIKNLTAAIVENVLRAKSLELYPSRLKQVVLPSVFHTEDGNILARIYKVDATMADHPFASGPIHFSKDAELSLDVTRKRSSPAMRGLFWRHGVI